MSKAIQKSARPKKNRSGSITIEGADRVESLLLKFIARDIRCSEQPAAAVFTALSAIFTQGLGTTKLLEAYLAALPTARIRSDGAYVSFVVDGFPHRYRLSPFSAASLSDLNERDVDWNSVLGAVEIYLTDWYSPSIAASRWPRISALLGDVQFWLRHYLPDSLNEHVCGRTRMTPLPELAWDRRANRTHPRTESLTSESGALDQAVALGMSDLQCTSGAWFVDKVMSGGFGLSEKRLAAANMQRLAGSLILHLDDLQSAGALEAIWFGWLLYVASFGSVRRKLPAASTLRTYLTAAPRIYRALCACGINPVAATHEELRDFFAECLEMQGQGGISVAALASFHDYLVREFGVAPCHSAFIDAAGPKAADANIIWNHEFQQVPDAISRLTGDLRLREVLAVWHCLLGQTTLRIGELAGLRLCSVKDFGDRFVIEITQQLDNRPLKTRSARRQEILAGNQACELLRAWMRRRLDELPESERASLFWQEDVESVHFAFARAYRVFAQALREVTGDPTVRVHHTRHTTASIAVSKLMLSERATPSISPVAEMCARMGHADSATLFGNYVHIFEDALQTHIHSALKQLPGADSMIALWLKRRPPSAGDCSTAGSPEELWRLFDSNACSALVGRTSPLHGDAVDPLEIVIPPLTRSSGTGPSLTTVARVIADLSAGRPSRSILLRANRSDETLYRLLGSLESEVARMHGLEFLMRGRPSTATDFCTRLEHLQPAMQTLGLRCKRLSRPVWRALARHLEVMHERSLRAFLQGCSAMVNKNAIVPRDGGDMARLLEVLRHVGFRPDMFVVKLASRELSQAAHQSQIHDGAFKSVDRAFRHIFGCSPQVEGVKPRRGRPKCFVQLLTKPVTPGTETPPATNDTRTLLTLALAASVFLELKFGGSN